MISSLVRHPNMRSVAGLQSTNSSPSITKIASSAVSNSVSSSVPIRFNASCTIPGSMCLPGRDTITAPRRLPSIQAAVREAGYKRRLTKRRSSFDFFHPDASRTLPREGLRKLMSADALTLGFDHVGLTVADLESSRLFFVDCLGWKVVGERPAYPAVYLSDGRSVLTLWRVENPADHVAFDRRKNVGLHHLALKVADRAALDA